jgi:hypothetical protein
VDKSPGEPPARYQVDGIRDFAKVAGTDREQRLIFKAIFEPHVPIFIPTTGANRVDQSELPPDKMQVSGRQPTSGVSENELHHLRGDLGDPATDHRPGH